MDIKKLAKSYIKNGFSVIPCGENKTPIIPNWGKYQISPMDLNDVDKNFRNARYIGVLTGGKSRLFCLDFDLKYDLANDLWERYKNSVPNSILKKAYIQKTKNGGYHMVFIAPESRLFGNQKFASRVTTEYEKHETYMHAFNNPDTRAKALKIAGNDKSRVLIESRSGTSKACGGYFIVAPSPGYEHVYGKMQEISESDYDILVEVARSFNDVSLEEQGYKVYDTPDKWDVSPFEHFNEQGDSLEILISNGWEIVSESDKSARLRRAGHTHSKSSALYDKSTKIFNCFSTSTSFEVDRGYNPTGVFIEVECDGNAKDAYGKLIELGWGIKK